MLEKMECGVNYTTEVLRENVNELIDNDNNLTHNTLSGINDVGGHDAIYSRRLTVSELSFATGLVIGQSVTVTDRDNALATIESGTANGRDLIAAGAGKIARIPYGSQRNLMRLGGVNSSVADNYGVISNFIDDNLYIPKGNYGVSGTILLRSENYLKGDFWGFGGTVLTPLTNAVLFSRDPTLSGITRTEVSNIVVACHNITSNYVFNLTECFLFVFEKIWLKDIFKGVNITDSDSITFRDLIVMETSRSTAVTVGNNARSLRFIGCNFETSVAHQLLGGVFEVNGTGSIVSSADLIGCQFERSGIIVDNGKVNVVGGKSTSSEVNLKSGSRDCSISTDFYDSRVRDFGFNNTIKNAYCNNMATPEHKWPNLISSTYTGNRPLYGVAGDEIVYLVTATSKGTSNVTGGAIEIKEGATTLSSSPSFNLTAAGESVGLNSRNTYTYYSVVKNATAASNPNPVGAFLLGVKGGISLLPNSTFDAGTSTSWLTVNASTSASGANALVTPSSAAWGLYQSLTGKCQEGKKYIAVAVFSGNASLFYGSSWDGSAGVRVLSDLGVDLYGDGFKYAMISFEYHASLSSIISLGSLSSSSAVTIKSFALIEA